MKNTISSATEYTVTQTVTEMSIVDKIFIISVIIICVTHMEAPT